MAIAIISDVHSNKEALDAVLADIHAQKDITEVLCAGDVVGYGPNPEHCSRRVKDEVSATVMGNHDKGVSDPSYLEKAGFNQEAMRAVYWSRERLEGLGTLAWLGSLALHHYFTHAGMKMAMVHGSYHKPEEFFYIHSDPYFPGIPSLSKEKMQADRIRVSFVGHSHDPCAWRFNGTPNVFVPTDEDNNFALSGYTHYIINVGSVGQPRTGDKRACYVILDGPHVTFRRVDYPYVDTMQKIWDLDEALPWSSATLLCPRPKDVLHAQHPPHYR